jgi:ketosteroid isomerase-like protein
LESNELQDLLVALEDRVRLLEDKLAIQQILNSWGPAVDSGNSEAAAALFAEDGFVQTDRSHMGGPSGVSEMVEGDGHQALIRQGCAHIQGFPILRVDGDRADATGYSRVYLHSEDGWKVFRCSANHWQFRRTNNGWKVTSRQNHVIDGRPEALAILGSAFAENPHTDS